MRRFAAIGLVVLLAACGGRDVAAPVPVPFEGVEADLATHLRDRLAAAQAAPESAPMRGRLAMAYDANGFVHAAVASYRQAAALDPQDSRWPYLCALRLAETGGYGAALQALDHALDIDPRYAPAWLWRGTWLFDQGDPPGAARAFAKALEAAEDPDVALAATVYTARAQLAQDAPLEAVETLGGAEHPYAFRLLARAHRALGDESAAAAASAQAVSAEPLDWPDPHRAELARHVGGFSGLLSQAESLLEAGNAKAAVELLEALRERRPTDRTLLNNLAVAYGEANRPGSAFDVLLDGVDAYPDYYLFHFNLAAAYETRGETASALRHVDRALALQSGVQAAHELRVRVLMRLRRHEEALKAVDAAIEAGAHHRDMLYDAAVLEGAGGRWDAAIRRFEQLTRFAPDDAKGHLFLGHGLAEAGRLEDAESAFDRAAALGAAEDAVRAARERLAELQGDA
jgi:tetratricopeptide (TPR) repeat protein